MLILDHRFYTPDNFKTVWDVLRVKYIRQGRYIGSTKWTDSPNTINVIGVRSNPEIAFNDQSTFNDDMLLIYENTSTGGVRLYSLPCTMDPKARKKSIAHLLKGIYASYRVRPHRWILGRDALCQDVNKVNIARTDIKGNVIKKETDFFGINIHDSGGYRNSSLGCTILASNDDYKYKFRPLILRLKQPVITYLVTDLEDINQVLSSIVEFSPINAEGLDIIKKI